MEGELPLKMSLLGKTESRDVCCNIVNLQIYIVACRIWADCELSWCEDSSFQEGGQDTADHNLKARCLENMINKIYVSDHEV